MLQLHFTPFPILQTERLLLRQLTLEDDKVIFQLRSDNEVNRYIDRPRAKSIEDARQFIEKVNNNATRNEGLVWGIVEKASSKLAGTICFWNISRERATAEIGYELVPGFQGKGIMQEAFGRVIQYGFDIMKVNAVEAIAHKDNASSSKLLNKYHFERDEALERNIKEEEGAANLQAYSLSRPK